MKIVLAPDSFKGSLSAPAAAAAMQRGLHRVWPDAEYVSLPIADGGEGTLDALMAATGGELFAESVTGPLEESVIARWGLFSDGETAVIELAEAAGLTLIPAERRDPKMTTTYGVGELILHAANRLSVRRLILGLGGSATNDGGAGILTALGVRLLDASGDPLPPGGASLIHLNAVDASPLRLDPAAFELFIACDVDNPLTGERGASAIFGPQKGATPNDVAVLDAALAHYASLVGDRGNAPGDGAAGGAGFGLRYLFPNTTLRPGIDLVLDAIRFDEHLVGADLILTGEGKLDGQTLGGKAIAGVARRAKAAGVPIGALVGSLGTDVSAAELAEKVGVAAVMPIIPRPCALEDALRNAADWLTDAAERAARWKNI